MSTTIVPAPKRRDEQLKGGARRAPQMFTTGLESARMPARGLFYSLVAHLLFALATLAVPWNYWMPAEVHLETARSQVLEAPLLLPDLQPMGEGSPAHPSQNNGHGDRKKSDAPAASAEAGAVQGVVYEGLQLIVSNPPHPDNYIQTIRQPDLPVTPKLPAPLPIPPMVSIAPVNPVLAAPAPQPEPPHEARPVQAVITPPLSLSQQLPKVDAPKLPLPASAENSSLSAVATAPTPAAIPKLATPPAQPAVTPNGTHNILVVDALPNSNPPPSALPPGELTGTFTVSPNGSTSTGQAGGGTAPKGAPGIGSAAGAGNSSFAGSGSKSAGGSGTANPALAGAGAGTGTVPGNAGGGKQTAGNGSGTGAGHGSGSGGSANAGSGTSPFPGIMIQGGSGSGRGSGREPAAAKPQTSYGMTIVASGASGGGFKDYGVFKDGVSYTVYLDMADAGLHGPNWTMQYGLDLRPSADPNDPPQAHGFLQPPYAISKSIPHFTAEAARRSRGGTIVVFGVINPKGKWEGLRIMQSPDPGVNQIVLNALANWTFKPAEMDGAPVPVKCLLGVVVNSVPVE